MPRVINFSSCTGKLVIRKTDCVGSRRVPFPEVYTLSQIANGASPGQGVPPPYNPTEN